jgi:Tol biopolymer transport system component
MRKKNYDSKFNGHFPVLFLLIFFCLSFSTVQASDSCTNSEYSYRNPAWSPNGEYIVFTKEKPGFINDPEIGIYSVKNNCIKAMFCSGYEPVWSPDGKMILFVAHINNNEGSALFTIDINGKNKKKIFGIRNLANYLLKRNNSGKISDFVGVKLYSPCWGKNNKVYFIYNTCHEHGIMSFDLKTKEINIVFDHAAEYPRYSDILNVLLFNRTDATSTNILFLPVYGNKEPVELMHRSISGNRYPSWSPDSRFVAFSCDDYKTSKYKYKNNPPLYIDTYMATASHICIIESKDISSGNQIQVRKLTKEGFCFWSNWSPDGKKIVFSFSPDWSVNSRFKLYTIDADGRNLKKLFLAVKKNLPKTHKPSIK